MSFSKDFTLMCETFDLGFDLPEMRKIQRDGICNNFNMWPPLNEDTVNFFKKNKKYSVSLFLPASTVFLRSLKKRVFPARNIVPDVEFASAELRKLDRLQENSAGDVYWIAFPECDSSLLPVYLYNNKVRYKNRAAAYQKIKEYFEGWDILLKAGGKRKCKMMGIAGHPGTTPMLCEMGMDACLVEICIDSLYDIHPSAAMVRGVSRQHNKKWGLDFSHWRHHSGPTVYDDNGRRISGWSENYLERNLYTAYMAGAEIIRIEETAARHPGSANHNAGKNFCFIPDKDEKKVRLTPAGRALRRFAGFCRKVRDRGEPVRPVALMFDKRSGWNPKSAWNKNNTVWQEQFPYNHDDHMYDHFMNLIYEGHHRHGGVEGAPFAERREYDFWRWEIKDKDRALRMSERLIRRKFDTRPFESVSSAVYGDSFDFITSEAGAGVIGNYKLLIPLGRINFPERTRAAIREFAANGGTALLNAAEAAQWDGDFSGVTVSKKTRESCVSKCLICGRAYDKSFCEKTGNSSEIWYKYPVVEPLSARVLAVNDRNDPLVTENSFGKGRVLVMTPSYCSGSVTPGLMCRISEHFFRHVMEEFIPVKVTPAEISFTLSKNSGGHLLGIFNNNNFDWDGEIAMTPGRPGVTARSLLKKSGHAVRYEGGFNVISRCLKKFSFDIMQVTGLEL